ncbi:hypothetical protein K9M09_03080 [Patescibacteria group bacterium]|nr:hypothetical protein [Patescibacteria group bacterium]
MKNKIFTIMGHLMICALMFFASFQLEKLFVGTLPFALYFSIVVSLLILLKLDIKLSGDVKIRDSMSYIVLCAATIFLAALSGIDWMFSNLLSTDWHYLLTVEGLVLFFISLFTAAKSLTLFEDKIKSTSEEKMMFG